MAGKGTEKVVRGVPESKRIQFMTAVDHVVSEVKTDTRKNNAASMRRFGVGRISIDDNTSLGALSYSSGPSVSDTAWTTEFDPTSALVLDGNGRLVRLENKFSASEGTVAWKTFNENSVHT